MLIFKRIIDIIIDMSYLFYECSSLKELPDISKWNTNYVFDMSNLFYGCSSLIKLPDIVKWDMKNVKDISSLFCSCSSLISLPDISKWKFSHKMKINNIFKGCNSLLIIPDISKWNPHLNEDLNISSSLTYSITIESNKNDSFKSKDNRSHSNLPENSSSLKANSDISVFSKNNNELDEFYDNFFN